MDPNSLAERLTKDVNEHLKHPNNGQAIIFAPEDVYNNRSFGLTLNRVSKNNYNTELVQ